MSGSTNKPSHLRALLKKNWIIWRRSWCVSLLEIIVPVFFVFFLVIFKSVFPTDDMPQTDYYTKSGWQFQYDGAITPSDSQYFKDCSADKNGGVVALVPQGDSLIEDIKTLLVNQLGMTTQYFTSIDEINEFTSRSDYASTPNLRLCFGVVVAKNNLADKYEYTLMFNSSQLTDEQDLPKTGDDRITALKREDADSLDEYAHSGFLALQNMIDTLILRTETGVSTANIYNEVTSQMVPAYVKDDLALNLKGQTRLFLDLPLLLPFLRFINGMVTEKEKRIREGMKIMGLTNAAFYLSWFITYGIIFTIISLLVTIISVAGFFKLSSFGLIFLWHWEFTMCLMALGFFISIFFSKAKQANVAGFVIALVLGFFQTFASSDGASEGAIVGASIFPQASLGLAADHILSLEGARLGLTSSSVGAVINNYKIAYHYSLMFVDILVLLIFGSYLDQVLPSEFGVRKHPLFCCMRKRTNKLKKRNSQISDEADNMLENNKENFEETDPNLKAQDGAHESVMVQGLRKVYSTGKLAVDRVSFSMYKNQIFVLLGHNGAGKTSTISMITGLFSSTEGTTKVFGMDNQVHLDEIRKTMGVCPQHDILFDNMTVREHLQLYSVFKGVDPKQAPQEIEKIISDIGLADKRDYLSKNLSGGQKRKLSIGIAFLGGSKFIILDEPSSGMDTSARRKLWDMLKNYKQDRVVLLTTHFMDEADYLGDRIGIMGEGKLKCLGRSLFLKSRFGVGYNLTLVKKDINDPSKPIKEMILRHVPEGKVLSDVSAEVALQLPSAAAPKFQALFDELDKNLEKLRVSSYGISETTLEEVFLNVAKITTPEKHFQKDESPEAKIQMADENELDEFDIRKDGMHGNWDLFKTHFSALVVKRIQYFRRDKRGLVCEIFLPIIMVIVGILISKIDFSPSDPALALVDNIYGDKFQVDYNSIVQTGSAAIDPDFINNFDSAYFAMTAKTASTVTAFNLDVYNDQGQDILKSTVNVFSFYMDTYDLTNFDYKYTTFINTRAPEGSAFAMNKINNAILRKATNNANKQITVSVLSFQKTEKAKTFDNVISGAVFAFVFAIGMSFIPASVITFIVKEREMNVKHQQVVSGVSLFAYWFANYFVDIVKYLIPAIVNSLIAMAFNATSLIDGTKLSGLWAVFILYGFSVTPFVYLLGFLFRNYGTAQIAAFFINFGPGFIGGVAIGILKLIDSTRAVGQALQWILRILPTFAMTNGFLNLANRESLAYAQGKTSPSAVWSADLTGGDVLFLVIGAVFFTALIFLIEHLKNKQSLSSMMTGENKVQYVPKEMDDDVKREELEVEQSDNKTYSIKVDKLRKVYALGGDKYKVAVDRVSFGVRNGECFALLGVNGAGKTTTFKILSGDYLQTSGNAYINGYTIPGQMEEARKDIGYCPQFDALLDNLTAKEHLELYAAIKGIPKNYRSRLVDKQLREMNLKQYENVLAGTYSGGNKRKLSVAIAMIGNPAVVFLDEPSTGMDPEARRFMWNVISRISRERKQSSVILTTHSMEEAEALATKMGIMVNGGLKCLGTSQHIKNKFGGGYEVEVKLNLPQQGNVNGVLKSLGCTNGQRVDRGEVEQILDKMNMPRLKNELCEEGTGSAVHTQLQHGGTTPVELVVEWALIEGNGDRLMNFLNENFGQMTVMEHFQSFFRLQTTGFVTIGKFFGALEANKNALNILQYSIRQTTIEQIFNNFATEKVHVRVESRGEISIPVENKAELPIKNPQN